MQIVQEVMI